MSAKQKYIRLVHSPAQKITGWEGQSKVWQQIEITETASVWKEQLSFIKAPVTNERLHAGSPEIKMNLNKMVGYYSMVWRGNNMLIKCHVWCSDKGVPLPPSFCVWTFYFKNTCDYSLLDQAGYGWVHVERYKMVLSHESPDAYWLLLFFLDPQFLFCSSVNKWRITVKHCPCCFWIIFLLVSFNS